MQLNEVFFYQGGHTSGCYFLYDTINEELSIVSTSYVNFDNDEEGLSLKKLDEPLKTMTINLSLHEASHNLEEHLDFLLNKKDEENNNIYKQLTIF